MADAQDEPRQQEPWERARDERSLGSLFRRLADETGDLIRAEIALAKLEIGETIGTAVSSLVKLLIALVFAAIGGLTLVVFMVLGLGDLLWDEYWAGALITGTVLTLIGGVLAWRAIRAMGRTGIKPEETMLTLKEDKQWAAEELRQLRRGGSTPAPTEGAQT